MAYNDAGMNSADKQKIAALGEQWQAAQKAGNQGGMNEAHEQAELIRKKYGYSGGGDGSGFKIVGNNTVLPEAKDQSENINKIYDAQQKAKTDALKAAYDQNMADYDAQAAKIPQTYNEARRQVSTQADISRANLNEQMAGSGINVGAGSQLALSQQNSRNAAMGKVSTAEADALSDLEAQRQKVKAADQNAVAQAISENDAELAKALYTEAQRVDNSIVNTAVKQLSVDTTLAENERSRLEQQAATLAKYGDFSGYAALGYSQDQIDAMQKVWGAQNPKLYYERTGTYPASYTASNRRTGGGGSSGGGGDDTITPVRNRTDSGRITHNDIDFTNASAVADAATVSDRVKEMISQGVPVSEVNQYIQSASDNGLISDDSRRRLKYMNNSR
ncbi:MAG: hypothetical protein SO081_07305 [Oscillospiraceae bacterium]|nr:hypothetical protein [Oscillospiraceae bacterium]